MILQMMTLEIFGEPNFVCENIGIISHHQLKKKISEVNRAVVKICSFRPNETYLNQEWNKM